MNTEARWYLGKHSLETIGDGWIRIEEEEEELLFADAGRKRAKSMR